MKRFIPVLALLWLVCASTAVAQAATTQSLSQWGITWHFDKPYDFGQFANGDYWVLGPVTITRISPDYDGSNNGWEVNPVVEGGHGFQTGCQGGGFDPTLVPALPYTSPSSGIVSVVKTTPTGGPRPCVKTAAVLTIVTTAPPEKGATVFRPPYVGNDKPYYSINSLRTELLPSYAPVGSPPSLSFIAGRFAQLRLDHKRGMVGRAIRPQNSMQDYQPKNSQDIVNSALRFMLEGSVPEKMPALIQYIQAGIDKVHTVLLGQKWPAGGGHQPAHLLPLAFTATMLDLDEFKSFLRGANFFHGSSYFQSTEFSAAGVTLWGQTNTELAYWNYVRGLGGNRSNRDPYGYVDGGARVSPYQIITAQAHKGEVLAAHLMPVLKLAWPDNDRKNATDFAERWVNTGVWKHPDPCAPYTATGTYGLDYGPTPNRPGECILDPNLAYYKSRTDFACQTGFECGRFPDAHGLDADGGQYRSTFVAAMWVAYWDLLEKDSSLKPASPKGLVISVDR